MLVQSEEGPVNAATLFAAIVAVAQETEQLRRKAQENEKMIVQQREKIAELTSANTRCVCSSAS
jgi:hypothetical protein